GGAALARWASGTVAGRCRIQTWSCESTAMEETSPKTQLFGIAGHEGSGRNAGAFSFAGACAVTVALAASSAKTMVEMWRFIAAHGITIFETRRTGMIKFRSSRLLLAAACVVALIAGTVISAQRSASTMASTATAFVNSLSPEQ